MTDTAAYEVQFSHHQTSLAGTIYHPTPPGPYPALVMIQGSGPTDRDNFGYFPVIRDYFVQHGIVVLCYDKPGVGGSTGNWKDQDLRDRAGEALAARAFLQTQPLVDPRRVGLWGNSQGGWVVPLAASLDPDVAFIVMVSGPAVSPAEQDRYAMEHFYRAEGVPEPEIQQALTFHDALIEAARQHLPYAQLSELPTSAVNQAWKSYYGEWDEPLWAFLQRILDYDPLPVLEYVRCPILAIFGERDVIVPVPQSVSLMRQVFARSGQQHATIQVFPEAGHTIQLGDDDHFAPGFLETMAQWIQQIVAHA
jgi:uncharacterized protein